jgi:hypothetical protein
MLELNSMNKFRNMLIAFLISFFVFNNFNTVSANEKITSDKITKKYIEQYKFSRSFILRFSNIIYNEKDQDIKIPIFQGKYEDVLYKDFREYCLKEKLLEPKVRETGFMIKCKKGEVRKTFHEFIKFYKSSILTGINVEKPTVMYLGSTDWIIKYDFIVNAVPCYITIMLSPRDKDLNKKQKDIELKSVYDIIPDEDEIEPGFIYKIYIGSKSTD